MARFLLCALFIMPLQLLCRADVTMLPIDDQKVLREITRFHQIHAATNLPPAILKLCADQNGRLAEAGQTWERSDFIRDDKLPRHRMIWSVTDGDYYVVHYERGGYAPSFRLLVAKLKAGDVKPSLVWRGAGGQIEDFKAFVDALANNKLNDSRDYGN
jgi:hypothetical protein